MIDKAYVEITNICNLKCDFCAGHKRTPEYMSEEKFRTVVSKLDRNIKYLYMHLMGEPLIHPSFDKLLDIACRHDFRVMLTTNGTMLDRWENTLLSHDRLHKISISLHSIDANTHCEKIRRAYFDKCFAFAEKSSAKGIITVFRLWNIGGNDTDNKRILSAMHEKFPNQWQKNRSGEKIGEKLFLEWGKKFDWPTESSAFVNRKMFCHALRDQFGILVDGTVVPCCLDHDGNLALGNIFESDLDDILTCKRAKAIYDGFTRLCAAESYCLSCRQPDTYSVQL